MERRERAAVLGERAAVLDLPSIQEEQLLNAGLTMGHCRQGQTAFEPHVQGFRCVQEVQETMRKGNETDNCHTCDIVWGCNSIDL